MSPAAVPSSPAGRVPPESSGQSQAVITGPSSSSMHSTQTLRPCHGVQAGIRCHETEIRRHGHNTGQKSLWEVGGDRAAMHVQEVCPGESLESDTAAASLTECM